MNGEIEPNNAVDISHFETFVQPTEIDDSLTLPQQLSRLIFLSYRFSQGGIGTQNRMLLYIEENHQPELFSPQVIEKVKELTHVMVGAYFLNEKLHPATAIPWEEEKPDDFRKSDVLVTNELAGLFERFVDRELLQGFSSDIVGIAESVIVMDSDYLSRQNGRASSSEKLKTRVGEYSRDPFESQFIKYGILGEPTRTVEYDDVFMRISSYSTIDKLDELTIKALHNILRIFIKEHSEYEDDERLLQYIGHCEGLLDGER